jgi:hypothetical protein
MLPVANMNERKTSPDPSIEEIWDRDVAPKYLLWHPPYFRDKALTARLCTHVVHLLPKKGRKNICTLSRMYIGESEALVRWHVQLLGLDGHPDENVQHMVDQTTGKLRAHKEF